MLRVVPLSSLHPVFPQSCPEDRPVTALSAFRNEPLSFQAAFRLEGDTPPTLPVFARVESALPLAVYLVGYVPVVHTAVGLPDLPGPGLFGDVLLPKAVNPPLKQEGFPWQKRFFEKDEQITLNAACDSYQALWLTVNEDQTPLEPGVYPVSVSFFSGITGEPVGACRVDVTLVDALLPPQKLLYTNWFHCDCLADYYGVDMFSDAFFDILRRFVRCAVRNGMNMLLLPAFTPPLDTPEGGRRRTAQLVRVTVKAEGGYAFDFSLMKRFLDVCRAEGMTHFEHAHLFTQWGARAAPQIRGLVNGREEEIFGWETDAAGEEYHAFLMAYLPAVTAFFRQEGLAGRVLFHISDEPTEENAAAYARATRGIPQLLEGFPVGDALSHFLFYEKGYVKTPIVVTQHVEEFVGRCDSLWCYYTGGQIQEGLSNRLLITPPERNRILGVQMYAHRIQGFLHWAYNYYYDILSHGLFDPRLNPCGYNNNPGTSYFVYPGPRGEALQSTRQKVFFEGLLDMRALELLEETCGRAACEALMERHFGAVTFHTSPRSPEQMLAFRQDLNGRVARAMAERSGKTN